MHRIFQNASDCIRMLQNASEDQNASECIRMLQNASECFRMAQNASDCFRLLQNALECFRLHQNASECIRMLLNVSECFRMLHIGSACFRHKPHTAHRTQHTAHSSAQFTAHNLAMQDSIYARIKHDLKFLPGSWIPQVSCVCRSWILFTLFVGKSLHTSIFKSNMKILKTQNKHSKSEANQW